MAKTPTFDEVAAHRWYSAECFNRAWDLIEQPVRSEDDDVLMLARSFASYFHWTFRPDFGEKERHIGYWQLSRAHVSAGLLDGARKYALLSMKFAESLPPFFQGYAHEALARVEALAGNKASARQHLEAARGLAPQVIDDEDRAMLEKDLGAIAAMVGGPG